MIKNFRITQTLDILDFGPGIYTFSDSFWAGSFGLDRSFYVSQNVEDQNCSNVMLV